MLTQALPSQRKAPQMSDKQDNLQTMIDEQRVGEYEIKPWSLAKIQQLLPVLRVAVETFKEHDVKLEAIDTPEGVLDLITLIMPILPSILSITIGITEEEALEMQADLVSVTLLVIIKQNLSYLKNLMGPLLETIRSLTAV